ncbi:I78 family peptidase inhibitor [Pseudooceanicola aestuarii]|uniref:I78 family peptidase inhibitor n=1 Tax=Pseudooceanicola aestuarii TaxID=2697319 RepID=UPI0013D53C0A|nr:I78 family peptidase inhibitor [Pseudooceanicola aestuarii]
MPLTPLALLARITPPARLALLGGPCLALAACDISGGSSGTLDSCQGNGAAALIGQPLEAEAIANRAGAVRVIEPDTVVTMDHVPSRLNLYIDGNDRITRVTCG